MNDKCAAGSVRFLELVSRLLEVPLREMGEVAVTGGLALDRGLPAELESRLGVRMAVPTEPCIVGALGAALGGMSWPR